MCLAKVISFGACGSVPDSLLISPPDIHEFSRKDIVKDNLVAFVFFRVFADLQGVILAQWAFRTQKNKNTGSVLADLS